MAPAPTDYLHAVNVVARDVGLDADQTRSLRRNAASWAMAGKTLTADELRAAAEVMTGRLTFDEARNRLGL